MFNLASSSLLCRKTKPPPFIFFGLHPPAEIDLHSHARVAWCFWIPPGDGWVLQPARGNQKTAPVVSMRQDRSWQFRTAKQHKCLSDGTSIFSSLFGLPARLDLIRCFCTTTEAVQQ